MQEQTSASQGQQPQGAEEQLVELVVLLDEAGSPIGTTPKASVHRRVSEGGTPLHQAFSCHILGIDGRLLLTRRALGKVAFPGVWTNAVCGHPGPGEDVEAAVRRRALKELGMELGEIHPALPNFRYRAADAAGMEENEVCPVFVARSAQQPALDPEEADDFSWVRPSDLRAAVMSTPFAFSPWLVSQVRAGVLDKLPGQLGV
ncbi:isopentenyl-diphosphate Delta-isomerase [Micrococcus terreus]|uniref:Isopentenyl-diphosphate Delta-isomerase n=1 Tax=Micrococcus terreus TaxID=574650 RepID=A0A1I7MPR0_9MICC|nr:isopentenyl-diphosphate Delta-isomerase [Micrococcus terreus]SFV23913.1 isopentenyl-diphosphate delta-isomerase [Micrococcus terreus]